MAQYFIGQIIMFAGNFAPDGFVLCDGRLLQISQSGSLYGLLGVTYGGDGQTTFGVPDLRGRAPLHRGTLKGNTYALGHAGGDEFVSLNVNHLPSHNHGAATTSGPGDTLAPSTTTFFASQGGTATVFAYAPTDSTGQTALNGKTINYAGAGAPHENRQPFQVINFCMSLFGDYPSPT